ncbi:MAG TPA: PaaI family thioesterase [Clostridiaceae bacterium]|nr:PaaI family thioesterase [Clostridiaceae bacterium]
MKEKQHSENLNNTKSYRQESKEKAKEKSDQEFHALLSKMIVSRLERNYFANNIGAKMETIKYQKAIVSLLVSEQHLNPNGTVHGGVLMTLADTAAGSCMLYIGQPTATIDLSYRFLKPVFSGDLIAAKARVIQSGKSFIVVDVNLYVIDQSEYSNIANLIDVPTENLDQKLIGTATASFFRRDRYLPELPPEILDLADQFVQEYIAKKSK